MHKYIKDASVDCIMKSDSYTIRVKSDTRELLKTRGCIGETYDDAIRSLLIRDVVLNIVQDLGTDLQPAFDKFWRDIYPEWKKDYGFERR